MTLREFIETGKDRDIDVVSNYTDDLMIAYCGSQLTKHGYKKFESILDLKVEIVHDDYYGDDQCMVMVDDGVTTSDEVLDSREHLLRHMLYGMAGYFSEGFCKKYFRD